MTRLYLRSTLRNLIGTTAGMALVALGNLAVGATWAEVQARIPGYVATAIAVAAILAAYDVWKAERST